MPIAVTVTPQLDEEHSLPAPKQQLSATDRDRFTSRAEEHRHAPRSSVLDVQRRRVARDQPEQECREVLEQTRLELVDAHAARRMSGVDAGDAGLDPRLTHRGVDFRGDVPRGEARKATRVAFLLDLQDGDASLTGASILTA